MFTTTFGFPLHSLTILDPPKRKCLFHFASTIWWDLRRYYADFPWNDYCFRVRDPSLCAIRITEGETMAGIFLI
ncbi:hypothetical protein E2C01_034845 [Portunus trituberculatus]|uniref:Uncharacterized protein n=1 Tax=Portunus trituberculatus TaxID=210409 RepID=A0A5B7F6T1_PORTR|nr:hypothetical protein [Portunus trituberculatus]